MSMSIFATAFMPASWHMRMAQQAKEHFERVLVRLAEPWDEDKTKFKKELVLDHTTFKPKLLFETPAQRPDPRGKHSIQSPGGTLSYSNNVLHRGEEMLLWQGNRRGKVYFTGDIVSPAIYRLDGPCGPDVWMSYMPAEVLSQRAGIRAAVGKCLIGGLGLGWFLEKVAAKRSVTEIVLVEKSADLLAWYGESLVERVRQTYKKPIRLICGDAWNELGQHGAETRHLFDIWDSFPVWVSREQRAKIATVKHFWGWGYSKRDG